MMQPIGPARLIFITLALASSFGVQVARAAITAGGLVVVGFKDNNYDSDGSGAGGNDEIAFLATETINAGEVMYITNAGWSNQSTGPNIQNFRNVDPTGNSALALTGNENLMKLKVESTIFAGTVLRTSDTSNSAFTWTTSGAITSNGSGSANYSAIDLKHLDVANGDSSDVLGLVLYGGSDHGDQIYIFQADGNGLQSAGVNPIANATNMIFALTGGDRTGVMDDGFGNPAYGFGRNTANSYTGGEVPNGLVAEAPYDNFNSNVYALLHTVDESSNDGDPDNDNTAFDISGGLLGPKYRNGTFGINMSAGSIAALQAAGADKTAWLNALNDISNWSSRTDLNFPSFSFGAIPEPSRALLLAFGFTAMFLRRRR